MPTATSTDADTIRIHAVLVKPNSGQMGAVFSDPVRIPVTIIRKSGTEGEKKSMDGGKS